MADIVFQPVARSADIPNLLLPTVLAQDAAGYLWGGGENGLVRYDGYTFRSYATDVKRPDGLRDYLVQALRADTAQRLWVGTSYGGLAYYVPSQDRFVTVKLGDDRGGARTVWGMDDDGAGGQWVATEAGLFHVSAAAICDAALHHDGSAAGLPDDKLQAVMRDRAGNLWVGSRGGLVRDHGGDHRFTLVPLAAPGHDEPEVSQLRQDSLGRIWVATHSSGAFVLAGPGAAPVRLALSDGAIVDQASSEITSIIEVSPGRVWLGTFGRGVLEVEGPALRVRHIVRDFNVPNGLDSNSAYALFRDRSGLVWVSTTRGLSEFNPNALGFLPIFGRPGQASGVSTTEVTDILVRADGEVWVASQVDGIDLFDSQGRRYGHLPVLRVFAMAEDRHGRVFIGTRGGLYVAEPGGKWHKPLQVKAVQIPGRSAVAGVFALAVVDDVLWIGGSDDGVWGLRVGEDDTVSVTRHEAAPKLTSDYVRAMEKAPDGRLVLAMDGGVDVLDPGSGDVEQIRADQDDPQGLSSLHIVSLAYDHAGRMWVGTDNTGICVLTGRDAAGRARFHRIGLADGLPNLDINRMLVDAQGRIWATTDGGIAVIDPDHFTVRGYDAADGAAIETFWSGSGEVMPWGDLLFGGLGGVLLVRPALVTDWTYTPEIVVTDIRLGGKTVRPRAATDRDDAEIDVPHGAGSLAVEFTSLDLSAPKRNLYRYRLEGFDRDWIETDSAHRTATYTNLPPGEYTLDLRGTNRRGVWSSALGALRVRVLPAWFETWWCRIAEAGLAMLVLAAVVQGRTAILRARQRELQRLVEQRTAELSARERELSLSQQKLERLAYFDSLTALPNRRAFNDELAESIARLRPGHEFALALIDLDGFKQVNDTLGHGAGDEVLVCAAELLREAVRENDFVARLGGDEFVILLRKLVDPHQAEAVCDRIVKAMAAPMPTKPKPSRIGASMGLALCPAHGTDPEELYRHVDLALYDAKRAGKGMWRWYGAPETAA